MTNQNDTQDEAERLDHPCRQTCSGWKQGHDKGYRAGVATVADKRLELAAKYSDLAAKYCASLAEVERLNEKWRLLYNEGYEKEKVLNNALVSARTMKSIFEEQLAAEKAKADEIKIGSCELLTAIFRVKDHSQKEVMNKADRLGKILSHKIEFYSTDSGDGVG